MWLEYLLSGAVLPLILSKEHKAVLIIITFYLSIKENPEDEAIGKVVNQTRLRDCKKLRFAIYESRGKSEIVNPKSEIKKSRSSVWLEHYTDNVGVSSSNLLGTTLRDLSKGD